MCYEESFFTSWAREKSRKREEIESQKTPTRPDAQPARQTPEREVTRRKEIERELEEIV